MCLFSFTLGKITLADTNHRRFSLFYVKSKTACRVSYPNGPSKYMLLSSIRSMMPFIFPSKPIGIFTKAALWFSLDLKEKLVKLNFQKGDRFEE